LVLYIINMSIFGFVYNQYVDIWFCIYSIFVLLIRFPPITKNGNKKKNNIRSIKIYKVKFRASSSIPDFDPNDPIMIIDIIINTIIIKHIINIRFFSLLKLFTNVKKKNANVIR
jgi:hypothetical protein